jgi:precorrin-6B methylase 2
MPFHYELSASSFAKTGADGRYDAHRPSYSPEALDYILSLSPSTSLKVVELGAGTGIFTRQLLESQRVSKVIAIDPNPGMREGFIKSVPMSERVELLEGYFDKIPIQEKGSADLVVAAAVRSFPSGGPIPVKIQR